MIFEEETYEIIGSCMEVHRILGRGHKEVIYSDALEVEFRLRGIPYEREKRLPVDYKGEILPHRSVTDFLIFGKVILEVKAMAETTKSDIGQVLNQLASSKLPIGLLINFGKASLEHKRIILSENI